MKLMHLCPEFPSMTRDKLIPSRQCVAVPHLVPCAACVEELCCVDTVLMLSTRPFKQQRGINKDWYSQTPACYSYESLGAQDLSEVKALLDTFRNEFKSSSCDLDCSDQRRFGMEPICKGPYWDALPTHT
eukprot:34813-Amphidinium_carterae.1